MRRRLTPQQSQENISRKSFEEFLETNEWVTVDISPDLGEDILVQVYDGGVSTGLSFYTQLKSTSNLEGFRLKSGSISYPFKVKDLQHWKDQGIPVLLVIWDIRLKQGCYIWAKDALTMLDAKSRDWRKKGKVKIQFLAHNKLDGNAFAKLRSDLAKHYFPIISKGKDLEIKASFEFPRTPEGEMKLAEFNRFLASGDDVELEGGFIKSFELPDWWTRLLGSSDPSKMTLKLGSSKQSPTHPFRIDFFSAQFGVERLDHIELRLEKGGEEEVWISNEQQSMHIKIRMVVMKKTKEFKMTITFLMGGVDGFQAKQIFHLQQILSSKSEVRFRNLADGNEATLISDQGILQHPDARTVDFVNKLCLIQNATGVLFAFPEDGSYTYEDEIAADELVSITQTGKHKQVGKNFSADFRKPGVELLASALEGSQTIQFQLSADDNFVNLLGKSIQLGSAILYIRGFWDKTSEDLKKWIENAQQEDSLKVELVNVEIVYEFENWPRSSSFANTSTL